MINTNYNLQLNRKNQPAFGGAFELATQTFKVLNESPAVGATIVDVGFMATPRTWVDSKRGFNAGVETGIRETSGSVNHAMIGAYGLLGALCASTLLNSKYGIKASNIKADSQTANLYSEMWQDFLKNTSKNSANKDLRIGFINKVFENTYALGNTTSQKSFWSQLPKENLEQVKEILSESIKDDNSGYKLTKDSYNKLRTIITSTLGTEQNLKVKYKEKSLSTTLESLLNDTTALSKAFTSEKIKPLYMNADKVGIEKFLKTFGKYKAVATFIGLGIGSAIGASVQPINRYLTKKRTGQDGFVGVNNNDKKIENKSLLNIYKGLASGAMGLLIYTALGGKGLGNIARNIQFKGVMPTLNQFKLVYGITIISRFLAARDTNELRESTFKDFLGYTNWLILGSFVSKLVANKFNPSLVQVNSNGNKKLSLPEWLANSSLKTQSEVLLSDAKRLNIPLLKDGKVRAFKDILQDTIKKSPSTKAKIRGLNIAQFAGLIYSGVVLGWAIPKINILVTNKINQKDNHEKTIEEIHKERTCIH